MLIGELIEQRRKALDLTLEQVGNAVGVGKSTVRKWETGSISNMGRDKISALAKILEIDPNIFLNDDIDIDVDNYVDSLSTKYSNISPIKTHRLPLLGEIACGEPIFCDEDRESYVEVGAEIHADFCLKAKGDSMINARILDGDIVLIRRQSTVDNGEIAAVVIDDEATLKRVYYDKENNQIQLCPENPKCRTFFFSGADLDRIHILGKAIGFESNL